MQHRPPPLILASSSPFRRELLARLGLDFAWRAPAIDETENPGESPAALAARLARAKARAIEAEPALVIGSDQAPSLDGRILRKPGGRDAAIEQLLACQGRTVTFHTAVCLREIPSGREWLHTDATHVSFASLPRDVVGFYVDRDEPFASAGGFKAEGLGIALFTGIESNDPTALIGLPLIALTGMLREAGVEPLSPHGEGHTMK